LSYLSVFETASRKSAVFFFSFLYFAMSALLLLSQDGACDEIPTFRGSLIPDRIVATTG
jgi:hypothetical protein